MSRIAFPLDIPDIAAFARSLNEQLAALDRRPSHVEMLNLLCRSAGFRNYQQFRAAAPRDAAPPAPRADLEQVEKTSRHFDGDGRLLRWPARANLQFLCLWVLWSRLPANEVMTERQIGAQLSRWHVFGDPALLRRALFDARLVTRTTDGREYRRIEQKPPAELSPLLRRLAALAA